MNMNEFQLWLSVANTLGLIAVGVTVWLRKPGVDAAAAVAKLAEEEAREHKDHRHRLTKIETDIQHMPTSDELSDLRGAVTATKVQVVGVAQAMERQNIQLDRIEEYLLNHKKS